MRTHGSFSADTACNAFEEQQTVIKSYLDHLDFIMFMYFLLLHFTTERPKKYDYCESLKQIVKIL